MSGSRRSSSCIPARQSSAAELAAFVKARIGSVKAPKQVEVWADLPRSKVGKVLKANIRATMLARTQPSPRSNADRQSPE